MHSCNHHAGKPMKPSVKDSQHDVHCTGGIHGGTVCYRGVAGGPARHVPQEILLPGVWCRWSSPQVNICPLVMHCTERMTNIFDFNHLGFQLSGLLKCGIVQSYRCNQLTIARIGCLNADFVPAVTLSKSSTSSSVRTAWLLGLLGPSTICRLTPPASKL